MDAMNQTFSRRDSLKWSGLVGLTALLGGSVLRAESPPATINPSVQGAGFYRHKLGEIELILLSDGGFDMQPKSLFPGTGDQLIETAKKQFLSPDSVPGHVNTLLIRSGGKTLLVDTGCGNLFGPSTGKLPKNLQRAGVDPETIDHVLITHIHPDHVGGLLQEQALFTKATIHVSTTERSFWSNPDLSKSILPEEMKTQIATGGQKFIEYLKAAGNRVHEFANTIELLPGVRVELAAGHTPGHVIVSIESGQESLLYITDCAHMAPLQFVHPEWKAIFDVDAEQGIQTRQKIYERCAADRLLVAGSHLPFPGFGHIDRLNNHYAWVPIVWRW